MTEQEARDRIKEEKEFFSNLTAFVLVNAGLMTFNLTVMPDFWWFLFPLLGWGASVFTQAVSLFGLFGFGGQQWEEQRMHELMGQEETKASLNALRDQLQRLERGERIAPTEPGDADRLQRRIENLEAIVTSRDWDRLEDEVLRPEPRLSLDTDEPDPTSDAERTDRLARRVQ